MNVNYDNEEADCFLVEAAIILAYDPGPMPKLLHSVSSPTMDAVRFGGNGTQRSDVNELQNG